MNLKSQRIIVFGSLLLQLLICNAVNLILIVDMPGWISSVILLLVPYLLWLVQLFIGRASGLTRGLSSSLIILVYLWNIIINLNGYEMMLYSPILIFQVPLILLLIAVVLGGYDFYLSFKNQNKLKETKNLFFKKDSISLLIASLLPVFMLYPGKAPLMTLAYVDQGVIPNYFSGGFLIFLTLPIIIMLTLSIINLQVNIKNKATRSRRIASVGVVVGLVLFAITSFFVPVLFWFGINPVIFIILMISAPLIAPDNYQLKFGKKKIID